MLDFLLVLGQVPGTSFQITYNELTAAFLAVSAIYEYRLRQKAIHRWCKWAWYRLGVNYRRRKRQLRTYIKNRRYRLAIFERKIKRNIRSYLRRKQRATELRITKSQRNAIRQAQRVHRLALSRLYRRISLVKRQYYIKLVQLERLERQAKRSRLFQSFVSIRKFIGQSV